MGSGFLEELAARRRFGMKPGLDSMRKICAALGNPERRVRAIHVAGTNGKGAVCAIIDAALREAGFRCGRYTSPHLVRINERFLLDGEPLSDAALEAAAERVSAVAPEVLTFFEALTAVAFLVYSESGCDWTVLETGLGGRLDATNVCESELCVITRVGLDHCDWLGGTVEEIAAEKAGIAKPGVPVVLGANVESVRRVVEARAEAIGAPFVYAPDVADESEIPRGFPLAGRFNRENAVTAIAALKTLSEYGKVRGKVFPATLSGTVWPGRFQRIRNFIIDGAHNPPAAEALAAALDETGEGPFNLVAGFCADKDAAAVLKILAPRVSRGIAVKTNNPRSLEADETARLMSEAGIDARAASSLREALALCGPGKTVVCGSLFLAGEALVELGGYGADARFDPSERLVASGPDVLD